MLGVDEVDLALAHVDGDVDEHRAGTAGRGDVERLLDDLGEVVGVLDQVVVLGDRQRDAGDVGLLERVRAEDGVRDLRR